MSRDVDAVAAACLLASVAALAVMGGGAWSDRGVDKHATPASEVLSAEGGVYDQAAGMCATDLVVDVVPGERVVIENELPVGNGRTVENTGQRYLTAVVPADSTVLIYAVDLEATTSKTLKTYHASEDCELQEGNDG